MIEIEYNRKKISVTIKGHAESGEYGHDLICAACSQTAYIFATAVMNMKEYGQEPKVKLASGDCKIVFKPYKENREMVLFTLDNIAIGFKLLAKSYPENVSLEVIEKE